MPKTTVEKIESIKIQQQQLENEKKKLLQQQKETDRKARTKRLIERGAILESYIPDAETITNEQIKMFLEKTIQTDFSRKTLDGINKSSNTTNTNKAITTTQGEG